MSPMLYRVFCMLAIKAVQLTVLLALIFNPDGWLIFFVIWWVLAGFFWWHFYKAWRGE